jgi:CheY-like chemotaxis protein
LDLERSAKHEVSALVVDDDVHMRSFLAELLEEEGFDVTTASNGFSGLRLAEERRPRVVLLDLVMPELSGADVLHELRMSPLTRDMAVVVVTGQPQLLSDAERADTDGIVAKPFDVPDLLAMVHRAVQQAITRRSEVAPVGGFSHHEAVVRPHRTSGRHTRGRR